jgi:hypothetical protein
LEQLNEKLEFTNGQRKSSKELLKGRN